MDWGATRCGLPRACDIGYLTKKCLSRCSPTPETSRLLPRHFAQVPLETLNRKFQESAAVPRKACVQQSRDGRFRLKLQNQ